MEDCFAAFAAVERSADKLMLTDTEQTLSSAIGADSEAKKYLPVTSWGANSSLVYPAKTSKGLIRQVFFFCAV